MALRAHEHQLFKVKRVIADFFCDGKPVPAALLLELEQETTIVALLDAERIRTIADMAL